MLPKTSYPESAARHLTDAQALLQQMRWDNAVYHAGYVVECALKTLVAVYVDDGRDQAGKAFNHDIAKLEGSALERLRVMHPAIDARLPRTRTLGTVLTENHPDRRYFVSGIWTENQARAAVARAEEIYNEILPGLLLDGHVI